MVSILNNYNDIFTNSLDIIEHKINLFDDNLIKINQKINKLELNIIQKDKEINDLKEDNKLKDIKISKLEDDNKLKDIKISKLEDDIVILKEDNKLKDIKISKLEDDILDIKNYNYINKIIIAIQDINSIFKLETKLIKLLNLRNCRNENSHYILIDNDDDNLIKYKIFLLNNNLKNLDINKKEILYDTIDEKTLELFINFLDKQDTKNNLDEKQIMKINRWWKY